MSLSRDLHLRELQRLSSDAFRHRHQVSQGLVDRLGLDATLEGHQGCVNCLQWSENGEILASGSDDVKVILWKPFLKKKIHEINTGHKGNIFSVKFMPQTSDNLIVSGAADSRIHLHDVIRGETIQHYSNHFGRVKRIEVVQNCPNIFWSASEDGTVIETDLRAPPTEARILVNLLSVLGKTGEAKCLSINTQRPEQLAVGASDPYVRVYDRRRIKAQLFEVPASVDGGIGLRNARRIADYRNFLVKHNSSASSPLANCSQYFVPGHLPKKAIDLKRRYRPLAATYVTFSPDGQELLVNLGGEQIYLYDLTNLKIPLVNTFEFLNQTSPQTEDSCDMEQGPSNGFVSSKRNKIRHSVPDLSPELEALKLKANQEFEARRFTNAVNLFNEAIHRCRHPILLGNRAAALVKRNWDGDVYQAFRDCYEAIQLDPEHIKAHLRMVRCLIDLGYVKEASYWFDLSQERFPESSSSLSFKTIAKELRDAKNSCSQQQEKEKTAGTTTSNRQRGDDDEAEDTLRSSIFTPEYFMADLSQSDSNESDEISGYSRTNYPRLDGTNGNLSAIEEEKDRRANAFDYSGRFCGHCNTTTDIKEASFFGSQGQFIVAGSDDGKFFCWNKSTGNVVRVFKGDESIVNCLQSHPTSCMLATSGIDPVVRIWAPMPEDGRTNEHLVDDYNRVIQANQRRMNADPFETILLDMGYRVRSTSGAGGGERGPEEDSSAEEATVQCRTQ